MDRLEIVERDIWDKVNDMVDQDVLENIWRKLRMSIYMDISGVIPDEIGSEIERELIVG